MIMAGTVKDFRMQEIHTPSAFEGAIWAATGVKDARTIFHAPPGCYINQHQNILMNDWTAELYSTNLSYANIMQGAEDKLEDVMRKVIARKPQAVVIITAPSVEVTQDDVEGVAKKVGLQDTVIIRPPIGGTAGAGKDAAMLSLLDIMETGADTKKNSVNIIGPTFNMFNWMADLCELKRMLSGIGVTVNTVMTAGATTAEIKRAPRAALNLCMYPFDCGVGVAREMEKRFGIPYLDGIIPMGFENSARWLEKIADMCAVDASGFVRAEMNSAMEFVRSNMVFTVTFEMSAALSFDNNNTYAVGIGEFFTGEVGVDIVMCAVSDEDAAQRVQAVCGNVLVGATIDEKKQLFVETAPMAIFGNFYDKKISMDEGFQNFIFADIPTIGYLNTENCPFMGFRGAKYLVQSLVNEVYMKIFLETKGEMSGPISTGAAAWEIEAEEAFIKVSEMIPHFVRATAMKKLHQVAEQTAQERGCAVTVAIIREVTDKYTPTKFKAKFSTVFENTRPARQETAGEDEENVPVDSLAFSMQWEAAARRMLELVPGPFRQAAVSGTEQYAGEKGYDKITGDVVEEYRKELGM